LKKCIVASRRLSVVPKARRKNPPLAAVENGASQEKRDAYYFPHWDLERCRRKEKESGNNDKEKRGAGCQIAKKKKCAPISGRRKGRVYPAYAMDSPAPFPKSLQAKEGVRRLVKGVPSCRRR